jgi:hypothetical protein
MNSSIYYAEMLGTVPLDQLSLGGEVTEKSSSILPLILWIGGIIVAGCIIYQLLEKQKERERENNPRVIYRE